MNALSQNGVAAKALERAVDVVGRHPITAVVVLSEVAFMLGSTGTPPVELWRVLLLPAYVTHLLLALVIAPHYWLSLAVTVAGAYGLDRLTQRWRAP